MTEQSKKKPQKLKARLPRGLADRGAAEIAATRQMVETIRLQFERYGFEPVETPAIEYTDALGKFLPDQDRPNEGVFSFQDDDEQWLSLRYDLTAPLARYVAERLGTERIGLPFRSYRFGWVFRNEKPGAGRFRQFMQFDADTVGAQTMAADAEMCMLAADTMDALGLKGKYVIKVNNRKVLDGVMESIGLGGEQNIGRRLTVLRAIDKFDRLGVEGVRHLLGQGRWDGGEPGKGDFTKGADLDDESIQKIIMWLTFDQFLSRLDTGHAGFGMPNPFYDPPIYWPHIDVEMRAGITRFNKANRSRNASENWHRLGSLVRVFYGTEETLVDGIGELEAITDLIEASGYGDRILVDPSVVRGLEYYTGPVFEVELTFEIEDEKGRPVRFGSVGGGGRYDGLIARFGGQTVPATGFSIGVSRLQAALAATGKISSEALPGPVIVTVFDREFMPLYQEIVSQLRNAEINAELYLGNAKGIGQQLKYADKRNAPLAIVQGSEERKHRQVLVKDLARGAELGRHATGHDEYLRMQNLAQYTVDQDKLVDAVRDLLKKHGLD
jgi:histidyl-tRNA synthetase